MSQKKKITDKVGAIIGTEFSVEDVEYVPDINNPKLTFGNTGLRFKATVLFIDLRGSTKLLNSHNKTTVAKIHMSYYHTIIQIAKLHSGEIRSFNGDSLLVFFQGTSKKNLSAAVKAAMQMRYMLADGIKTQLQRYTEIDFGIGVDYGEILCTKVGMGRDSNTKDIFWIGNAVNKSTRLSDNSRLPKAISVSKLVYDNLEDDVKYAALTNDLGLKENVNMWEKGTFKYNEKTENCYLTNWYWKLS